MFRVFSIITLVTLCLAGCATTQVAEQPKYGIMTREQAARVLADKYRPQIMESIHNQERIKRSQPVSPGTLCSRCK